MPVRLEALGTVTTIASVAIKPRVDTEIVGVHFADGARVKQGDILFTLDSRQIEAEIKRVEAVIAGAEAQLEQAQRDVQRYTELVAKNATTQVTLNNAQTQVNVSRALAESNKATLENLKVQLSYCTIRAPISGRIGMAGGQGRQHRAAGRCGAACDHQPDRADLRVLHGAAAQPAGRARGARGRDRHARGDRSPAATRAPRARSR